MMRRGAATDLLEHFGDALAAPWVAFVAGEKPMWWSPEKGVRTKKAGQPGQGCETGRIFMYVIPHYGSAPEHTRPETVDQVGNHTNMQNIKHARRR